MNTTAQQGLVRYAMAKDAPNKVGPNGNDQLVPKSISYTKGEARVSWQATFDRDSSRLTYKVIRDGKTATPVYQVTQDSTSGTGRRWASSTRASCPAARTPTRWS